MTLVLVVTDRRQSEAAGRPIVDTVAAALAGGAGAVLLREKDLPAPERGALAADIRALAARADAALVVASDVALAARVGADGVHLASADPWPDDDRLGWLDGDLRWPGGVSRSCHTEADLREAQARGAQWVTYSPVFATGSKPGYGPALGVDGLAAGCRLVPDLPVAALGGIDRTNAGACAEAGAGFLAVMGAVMRARDPAATVAAIDDEIVAALEPLAGPPAIHAGGHLTAEVDGGGDR